MGLLQPYRDLFEQVKAALQGIPSIKTVLVGEAFRLGELPMAVITPRETLGERRSMNHLIKYTINFDVHIIIRETEPENWLSDILPILCEAHDALMGDDTLGGRAEIITPTLFSPGEITAGNRLFYGGLIRFQAVILHSY